MPDTFAVTTTTTNVPLDGGRRGRANYTVSNTSGRAIRGRARIVPADPAAGPWLSLDTPGERDFPQAGTGEYTVLIAVPVTAPPGNYSCRLDIVGVDNPDEELTEGPAVTFTVPALPAAPKPFPWWIVAVAGALVLIGVIVGAVLLTQGHGCLAPPPGLVAWYPGDGTTADLVHHNDGIAPGGATFASGKVDQAFSFNGVSQFVQASNTTQLGAGPELSIDAWINRSTANATGRIVDKITAGAANGYLLDLINGQPRFDVGGTGLQSSTAIPLGTWTHLAATRSNAEMDLYINGVLSTRLVSPPPVPVNGLPLLIGAAQPPQTFFAGSIDEVDIFNRALTGSEVGAIFNAGSVGKCKNGFLTPGTH